LAINPSHLEGLIQSAENSLLSHKFDDALDICRRAIDAHPSHFTAYLAASRAAAELGQRDLASQFLDSADTTCGQSPEILAKRVELSRRHRDWIHAKALLEQTNGAWRSHFSLWAERAQLANATGDDAAADAAFEQIPAATIEERGRASVFRGQLA